MCVGKIAYVHCSQRATVYNVQIGYEEQGPQSPSLSVTADTARIRIPATRTWPKTTNELCTIM